MANDKNGPNGPGKVSTREFYNALLTNNERMNDMERRILARFDHQDARIDRLMSEGSPPLLRVERRQEKMEGELGDLQRRSNIWDGANSVGAGIAALLGYLFGR